MSHDTDANDGDATDADDHDTGAHDADDHGEEATSGYDPANVELPAHEPPLRSTAPQSEYLRSQVVRGGLIALVGLVVTFGLGILLA